jgi:peptidylprolyl isomerase
MGQTGPMATECPQPDGSSPRTTRFDGPPPMCIDPAKRYTAVMDTSMGEITIALDAAAAPKTVNNFVFLSRYHYYDGIIFHRIIQGFVCQGGDPEGSGRGGPGYRFEDELPKPGRYEVGSLAMANAGPNTNGSQFFIISGPNGASLPPSYSLFGKVVKGLDVVDRMEKVATGPGDRPREDVVIRSVTVTESE